MANDWSVLVQPLIVGYDGNTFVMHQKPERKAYKCYIPGNAAQPLVGDCGLATGFNEVSMNSSGTTFERVFAFTTLGAPAIPTVITSYLGVYDVRVSAEDQGTTFIASIDLHGPQVYRAKLYPLGMDVERYSEEFVIEMDMARRDSIPPGAFLMAQRGPMTRGSYLTLSGTLTVTATAAFASGFYVQAPPKAGRLEALVFESFSPTGRKGVELEAEGSSGKETERRFLDKVKARIPFVSQGISSTLLTSPTMPSTWPPAPPRSSRGT